jgi:hypothetical protein
MGSGLMTMRNKNQLRKIWVFDDGLEGHKQYTNKWIVLREEEGGGKLVLQNLENKGIIINRISEWKTWIIRN